MSSYRRMLFKLEQQLKQDVAVSIARYYELPAGTVDKIQRENPGTSLIQALEQQLIIREDEEILETFHSTLKWMKYLDLAKIMEDNYLYSEQARSVRSHGLNGPATVTVTSSPAESKTTSAVKDMAGEGRLSISSANVQAEGKAKPDEESSTGKEECKKTVEELLEQTQDVRTKEKDEVEDAGKDEETLKGKKVGKSVEANKETSPASPKNKKDEDVVKEKEIASLLVKEKNSRGKTPFKPADEGTAKEEEKEKDISREMKFSAPAELFYEDEKKKWALRGKGKFQILFDKENNNYLVEMKRDKDNTLCAKHRITKTIQLFPVRGSDRLYAWSARDSSDKESSPVSMVFSVRFGNKKIADNFQEEFQKAQTPVVEASPAGKGRDKKETKKESKKEKDKNDKCKGDGEPSKPSDEETAKVEEKEEGTSREIKFSAPAVLYYEDENKEWKLRGRGQFQILLDKENRINMVEMKRDKDNSLCAKHPITEAMQLVPVRGSDRLYAWSAMDASDKEISPVSMVFSVRLQNRETGDYFQEEFQKAQTPIALEPQPVDK